MNSRETVRLRVNSGGLIRDRSGSNRASAGSLFVIGLRSIEAIRPQTFHFHHVRLTLNVQLHLRSYCTQQKKKKEKNRLITSTYVKREQRDV